LQRDDEPRTPPRVGATANQWQSLGEQGAREAWKDLAPVFIGLGLLWLYQKAK